jgi:hypothetical protein
MGILLNGKYYKDPKDAPKEEKEHAVVLVDLTLEKSN